MSYCHLFSNCSMHSHVQRGNEKRINSTQRLDSSNLDKVKQGCQGIGCSNQEYDDFLKNILKGK